MDTSSNNPEVIFVTPLEQLRLDRVMFEVQQTQKPELYIQENYSHFSEDDAVEFMNEIVPKLDAHYGWLKQSNPADIVRLLNEVQDVRTEYIAKNGRIPTDADIYRLVRRSFLDAEPGSDKYAHTSVTILDAIMNGEVTGESYVLPQR